MKEHRFSLPFTSFGREHCISPMKPFCLKRYSLSGGTYEFKNLATQREWDRDCPYVRTVCARSFLFIRCGCLFWLVVDNWSNEHIHGEYHSFYGIVRDGV